MEHSQTFHMVNSSICDLPLHLNLVRNIIEFSVHSPRILIHFLQRTCESEPQKTLTCHTAAQLHSGLFRPRGPAFLHSIQTSCLAILFDRHQMSKKAIAQPVYVFVRAYVFVLTPHLRQKSCNRTSSTCSKKSDHDRCAMPWDFWPNRLLGKVFTDRQAIGTPLDGVVAIPSLFYLGFQRHSFLVY